MGQPLRRRHDRPDRLLLGLLRDGGLRHAPDARHRFPYRQFYPEERPHRAGRSPRRRPSAGARRWTSAWSATSAPPSKALLPQLDKKTDTSSPRCLRAPHYRASARGARTSLARRPPPVGRPASAAHRPRRSTSWRATDAIFTCDVGLPTVWAARYLAMNGKRRLLGSFWHGSMANAMAQAIGAQAACPGRQVVSAVRRRRLHHADGRSAQR